MSGVQLLCTSKDTVLNEDSKNHIDNGNAFCLIKIVWTTSQIAILHMGFYGVDIKKRLSLIIIGLISEIILYLCNIEPLLASIK